MTRAVVPLALAALAGVSLPARAQNPPSRGAVRGVARTALGDPSLQGNYVRSVVVEREEEQRMVDFTFVRALPRRGP